MTELLEVFQKALTPETALSWTRAFLVLVIGWFVAAFVGKRIRLPKLSVQQNMLLRRLTRWGLALLAFAAALNELGFSLAPLLGAAGILTVALGFASQTSVSNLISGLFLIGEQPFKVGDLVNVEGTTGTVLSVDVISIRIRTFDNLLVRIPNEKVLKATLTNYTAFDIRRHDLNISVALHADIDRVREVLLRVAEDHPKVLSEPEPLIVMRQFGVNSLDILFATWAAIPDFLEVRNGMHEEVLRAFRAEGIEIAIPHVALYAGSQTAPIPLALDDQRAA